MEQLMGRGDREPDELTLPMVAATTTPSVSALWRARAVAIWPGELEGEPTGSCHRFAMVTQAAGAAPQLMFWDELDQLILYVAAVVTTSGEWIKQAHGLWDLGADGVGPVAPLGLQVRLVLPTIEPPPAGAAQMRRSINAQQLQDFYRSQADLAHGKLDDWLPSELPAIVQIAEYSDLATGELRTSLEAMYAETESFAYSPAGLLALISLDSPDVTPVRIPVRFTVQVKVEDQWVEQTFDIES